MNLLIFFLFLNIKECNLKFSKQKVLKMPFCYFYYVQSKIKLRIWIYNPLNGFHDSLASNSTNEIKKSIIFINKCFQINLKKWKFCMIIKYLYTLNKRVKN